MLALLRQPRYLILLAFTIALGAVCTVAGVWQVQRYGEKHQANSELRHDDALPPAPVDQVLSVGQPAGLALKLRQVTATGDYDVNRQLLVRQREVDGRLGFIVLTPLRTTTGRVLLVARGFLPATGAATESPPIPAPPSGPVAVTGRVYPSEQGRLRRNLPPGQVERIDVPALARQLDAPAYGGYVELISSQPAQRGLTTLPAPDLSNPAGGAFEGQHLAYVVQWFIFAALALAAPFLLAVLERRQDARDRLAELTRPGPDARVSDGART